jgi:hypothetical protein
MMAGSHSDADPTWWASAKFEDRPMQDILASRDIGAVFRFLASRGWSRARIAAATGLTETRVRGVAKGLQVITSYDVLVRVADGLRIDRGRMGLAFTERTDSHAPMLPSPRPPNDSVETPPADHDDQALPPPGDPFRRRDLYTLAGAALAGAALESRAAVALDHLVCVLLPSAARDRRDEDLASFTIKQAVVAVTDAKRTYQAGAYPTVLADLPALLRRLRALSEASDPADKRVHRVSADAYHVAASILLKLGDVPLATVAADRSLDCAHRSGDPVTVAASTRIIVHALMDAGHAEQAHRLASETAQAVLDERPPSTPTTVSVVGALKLRGAVAAAIAEDRAGAHQLLDESQRAAEQVPEQGNLRWTGFNPTNVRLHRVNIALRLGDAGTAIDLARQINPAEVRLPERRASLYLDVAHAYTLWGKWDRAWTALVEAERAAPHEVQTRSAARRLVATLAGSAPASARQHVQQLAQRAGVPL